MTRPLALIAVAWAERKNETWRQACDRVAMGFICDDPREGERKRMVIEYRERCAAEERLNGHRQA